VVTRLRNIALAVVFLAGIACAGCSAQQSAPPPHGSVQSCIQFGVRAIEHNVTVRKLPAECRGLSRAQVNYAVGSAVRSVAGRVRGKARQRARAARFAPLLSDLVKQVPPSRPAAPTPPPPASQFSHRTLEVLSLCFWILTVGIGTWMMSRWFSREVLRGLRRGPAQADSLSLSPAVAVSHFGLAVSGLLAWIAYLASGLAAVGWVAGAILLVTAGFGMSLVTLGPEQRRSALVIAAHITLAVVTMLFTLLTVVGSG
jgi:hypothetical protein